jgi:hypothetical protein
MQAHANVRLRLFCAAPFGLSYDCRPVGCPRAKGMETMQTTPTHDGQTVTSPNGSAAPVNPLTDINGLRMSGIFPTGKEPRSGNGQNAGAFLFTAPAILYIMTSPRLLCTSAPNCSCPPDNNAEHCAA